MKINSILKLFEAKRILVVGDIMLDVYYYGEVNRISPEAPVQIVDVDKISYVLGGAANTANNIVSFGSSVDLVGIVGEEFEGSILKAECKKSNISLYPFNDGRTTTIKKRIMSKSHQHSYQQMLRADIEEKRMVAPELEERIIKSIREKIKYYDCITLSDYDKGIFKGNLAQRIIELGRQLNKKIVVDPKPQNILKFKYCTLICPNHIEAESITGLKYNRDTKVLLEMSKKLKGVVNSDYVVITTGKDGVCVYKPKCLSRIPTKVKQVCDVTGAGDTVTAILSLGLSCNIDLIDCAQLANYAARVVIEKTGTATIDINELKRAIKSG